MPDAQVGAPLTRFAPAYALARTRRTPQNGCRANLRSEAAEKRQQIACKSARLANWGRAGTATHEAGEVESYSPRETGKYGVMKTAVSSSTCRGNVKCGAAEGLLRQFR
jgi:hypothetical protein